MLNLTEEQIALIQHLRSIEIAKKFDEIRFENPDEDTRTIRRTIYLDGGLDMLKYLLEFDQKLAEQKEQEKQDLLQKQRGDLPQDPTPFDHPA